MLRENAVLEILVMAGYPQNLFSENKEVSHSVREGKGLGYQCHNPRASCDLITFSLPPNISEIFQYPFNKLSFYSRNSLNGFASLATKKP